MNAFPCAFTRLVGVLAIFACAGCTTLGVEVRVPIGDTGFHAFVGIRRTPDLRTENPDLYGFTK